jgi:hypothetical protein
VVPVEKAWTALHEQSSAVTTRNYLWRWSSDNSDRIVLYFVLDVPITSERPHQAPPTIDAEAGTQARRLFSLLDEWLADESGYDEETWPQLKEALDHGGVAMREPMSDE